MNDIYIFYLITNPKTTLCGIYELPYKVPLNFTQAQTNHKLIKLLESGLENKEKMFMTKKQMVCIRNWLNHYHFFFFCSFGLLGVYS